MNELDELLSTHECECAYDLNGNLISKKTASDEFFHAYDSLDRLVQVVSNDVKVEYAYDPLNRRVSKRMQTADGEEVEHYLYDGDHEIGAFSAEGTPKQLRVLGLIAPNGRSSTVAIELGSSVFSPLHDLQGNIRGLVDPATKGIAEYDFTAFGRPKQMSQLHNPWRYASKRLEMETGLIDFGKRWYDSQLSRWLTTDPAGFIDNLNLYSYVRNNPLRYTDLHGNNAALLYVFVPLFEIAFDGIISWLTVETALGATAVVLFGVTVYEVSSSMDTHDGESVALGEGSVTGKTEDEESEAQKKKRWEKFKFPANPDDLLPELLRDRKGRIQAADNVRIRPERHDMEPGQTHNPRHHDQHYHVESRRDPSKGWGRNENIEIIKPQGYKPPEGTGFLPGEYYPGVQMH